VIILGKQLIWCFEQNATQVRKFNIKQLHFKYKKHQPHPDVGIEKTKGKLYNE
jgi:hypothetical protein